MIRSMTGYGRAEAAGVRVALLVECKSVNHRHLDIALKLPRLLGGFELDARRLVQSAVQRGRVEVAVSLAPVEGATLTPLTVNAAQAREFAAAARRLAGELGLLGEPTVEWVLGQPGVVTREEQAPLSAEEAWPLLEQSLSRALAELVARREAEGLALSQELAALRAVLGAHVDTITQRAPATVERRTARLRERIQTLLGETPLDETRIATEIAVWAEKTDISEELARLRSHLEQFSRLLAEGGTVGRTLDFLIQEINRELNTVGSKADDLEISQAVIAAKTTLEKLREQAQNLE
jgi:uncharacterized protein (TIGR00255 family)